MTSVVVTGASGHVGANLVRKLIKRGHSVRALVRRSSRGLDGLDIHRAKGDILDPRSLDAAFEGAQVVYHLAAYISLRDDEKAKVHNINVVGTRNVVSACLRQKISRLVHASSVHAFQACPGQLVDETHPLADEDAAAAGYDISKAQAERAVLAGVDAGLDAVIATPSAVLGPHDYLVSHMGRALLLMAKGHMPAVVDASFDWVDSRDVAAAMIDASEKGVAGEKYILSGHQASMRELATHVEAAGGKRAPKATVPLKLAALVAPGAELWGKATKTRPLFTREAVRTLQIAARFTHQKAATELGYHPRPTAETVRAALLWLARKGMLQLQ